MRLRLGHPRGGLRLAAPPLPEPEEGAGDEDRRVGRLDTGAEAQGRVSGTAVRQRRSEGAAATSAVR